jgi:O-antigen ligase
MPRREAEAPPRAGLASATAGPTPVNQPVVPDKAWLLLKNDSIRRIGFYFALTFVFFRFSLLHELLTAKLGFNTYILYLIGPPALLLLLMTRGLPRALRSRTAWCWLLLTIWMAACVPFSFWPGGSLGITSSYIRTEAPMLFLVAGMAVTLAECYQIIAAISLAAAFNVYMAKSFAELDIAGRFNIAFSSIANANDMAAHLLLVLPILGFYVFGPQQRLIWRVFGLPVLGYGLYLILGTGSRGAFVSLLVMVLVLVWKGSGLQRTLVLAGFPVAFLLIVPVLPQATSDRLLSVFSSGGELESSEAQGSRQQRMYLLQRSLLHTFTHPIFGVGPGQFLDYDSNDLIANQKRGTWQVSHNAYTQISSELGIPGLLFMLGGTLGAFITLKRLSQRLRNARDCLEVRRLRSLVTMVLVSQASFCTSIFFLSLGYRFYLPFIAGLTIALHAAIDAELPLIEQAAANAAGRNRQLQQPRSVGGVNRDISA